MAIYVKDPATEAAVRGYAACLGLSVTAAIRKAVEDAQARDDASREAEIARKLAAVRRIQARVAKLPELMTAEEVDAFMYDENGLPH